MARRFIVKDEDIKKIDETIIEIYGTEVKHIQVLRYNVEDIIIVNEYECKIIKMLAHSILLEQIKKAEKKGVPNIEVTLYMAMLKNEKMDFVVQKATEIGVKNIVPFFSKNVIVKLDEKARKKRIEKLQVVANEACKQCGRTDKVTLQPFEEFKNIIEKQDEFDISFLAYENEERSLKEIIRESKRKSKRMKISIIIGAEGGFTKEEVAKLLEVKKVNSISLGTRILRAETAALNLLSIIMYEFD